MSEGQPQTVKLQNLRENDYNPRDVVTTDSVQSLKNSIEQDGLLNPLTVRPVDGEYEVIAGSRRLTALRDLYDGQFDVPVTIRDVDDKTARRMALAENIEREDLTTMEETQAFAREIEVEFQGSQMTFSDYIDEVNQIEYDGEVNVPSSTQDVRDLSDAIDRSNTFISDRLSFLTLPDKAHELIDSGELTIRAARIIARLRRIDNWEYRNEQMENLIHEYGIERDGIPDEEYEELEHEVKTTIEHWEEIKELRDSKINDYEKELENRKTGLREEITDTVKWLNNNHLESDQKINLPENFGDIDDIETLFDWKSEIARRINEVKSSLQNRRTEIQDKASELERKRDRVQRTAAEIIEHETEECPYCLSDVDVESLKSVTEELEERIDELEDEAESISTSELNEQLDEMSSWKKQVESMKRQLKEAKHEVPEL